MKKLMFASIAVVSCIAAFTGCRQVEVAYSRNTLSAPTPIKVTTKDGTTTEYILPKDSTMEMTVKKADESLLSDQAMAGAGSVQALKVVPAGDSSTPMFEIIVGGGNNAWGKVPADSGQTCLGYSRSMSVWGSISSASASGVSFFYVSPKGETPAETVAKLKAMKEVAEAKSK